jgi:hypothetical protein
MSDWDFLNDHRMTVGPFATSAADGFVGYFSFPLPGEARRIFCIASDGEGWQHVSVSFGKKTLRTPSWEVMASVKALFWEPEDCVVQYHPRASQYRNLHPGCLHLWRWLGGVFPEPRPEMIA